MFEPGWGENKGEERTLKEWENWNYSWMDEDWVEDTTTPLNPQKRRTLGGEVSESEENDAESPEAKEGGNI